MLDGVSNQKLAAKQLLLWSHNTQCKQDQGVTILAKLSPGSNARSARGNGGIFIPPDVVPGRRIFFLVDNVDFAEDTPDGKRTLHGTAMAIFQKNSLVM